MERFVYSRIQSTVTKVSKVIKIKLYVSLVFSHSASWQVSIGALLIVGTLRYEDGKARTGTAVDAGNFRGSRCVVKNKMLKMRIFSKEGDVNNSNFVKAIPFTETVTSFRL